MKPANNTLTRPEETIVFLVYPHEVNYQYVKLRCTVQPGVAVSPHRHPRLTETFRLMSSEAVTIVIEGKAQTLRPNDPIATTVRPNAVHEWVNDTQGPVTFEVEFSPLSGQSLQAINVLGAFTCYFALMNERHKSPHFLHKLLTAMKLARVEYTFRDFSVSASIVERVEVFLLAQMGYLLGLKSPFGEASPDADLFFATSREGDIGQTSG